MVEIAVQTTAPAAAPMTPPTNAFRIRRGRSRGTGITPGWIACVVESAPQEVAAALPGSSDARGPCAEAPDATSSRQTMSMALGIVVSGGNLTNDGSTASPWRDLLGGTARPRCPDWTERSQRPTFPSIVQGKLVTDDLDLLQGTLDLLVLKALTWGPSHGYAVAPWVAQATDADLEIQEGALYTALHRMEKRGWLDSEWGLSENNRRAKYYELTPAGRRQLRAQTERWTRYARAVFKVLETA